MNTFRHFTAEDIQTKISMVKAIKLMHDAFLQLSSGHAVVPTRTVIDSLDHAGRALFMPSYSPSFGLFGIKNVSVYEKNTASGLPIIQGKMLVMDAVNGMPLAMLDATYLTALRTGAASGLATDWLARKDAKVLAIFGTGAQAETQLEGILAVRKIQESILYGRKEDTARTFCQKMKEKFNLNIHPAGSQDELKNADIICTATTSHTPVFRFDQLKRGVHINAIGSYKPSMQEVPSDVMQKSTLIVDQRKASLTEAGDIIIPIEQGFFGPDHIHAELGEIISGREQGRTSEDEWTVFKSVGNAIQDLAIARGMLMG